MQERRTYILAMLELIGVYQLDIDTDRRLS